MVRTEQKSVDILHGAREFYAMEAIRLSIAPDPFLPSNEKWLADFNEYRDRYTRGLESMIYDYTVLAVAGEMRHAKSKAQNYNPYVPVGGNRSGTFSYVRNYTAQSVLFAAYVCYCRNKWHGSSFGGPKWGEIARVGLNRERYGRVCFIDTCFTLSHNSSPYFNKSDAGIFTIGSCDRYTNFLDLKRGEVKGNHDDLRTWNIADLLCETKKYVGYILASLMRRACVLGILPEAYMPPSDNARRCYYSAESSDEFCDRVLSYEPIRWGEGREWSNKILPHKLIPSTQNKYYAGNEEDEDEEIEDEDEDEDENDAPSVYDDDSPEQDAAILFGDVSDQDADGLWKYNDMFTSIKSERTESEYEQAS